MKREKKITLEAMRSEGERDLIVFCLNHKCSHSAKISGDGWPAHLRLSDLEPMFVCKACGLRGAEVRPAPRNEHVKEHIRQARSIERG